MTRLIREVGVRPIRDPLWQMFPAPGGITGLWLLAESHLAVHTYPETQFAAISLYCCRSPRDYAVGNPAARVVRGRPCGCPDPRPRKAASVRAKRVGLRRSTTLTLVVSRLVATDARLRGRVIPTR